MRKTLLGGWVVLLLVAGVGAAGALSLPGLTLPDTLHSTTTQTPISGTITKVVLDGQVGDLVVQAGMPSTVATRQQWNLLAPTVTQSESGGVLTVTTKCPNVIENNCSVDVTVTLPAKVIVDATAGVGDIATRNLVGAETLRTYVGDVDVSNLRAPTLGVATSTGSITVALPTAPIAATLESQVGDVNATVPAGAYALTATTQTGEVQVSGVTNSRSARRSLTAQSQTGDVNITGK
jgi:hypothetical protein